MKLGNCTATVIVRSQAFEYMRILRVRGDATYTTSHSGSFFWTIMPEIPAQQTTDTQQAQGADATILDRRTWRVAADIALQQSILNDPNHLLNPAVDDREKELMDNSCPTGACPPDRTVYKDVYQDLLSGEAKKTDSNLDDPQERREVHMRVVQIMRPQVRENRRYLESDKEGPAFAKGPEFILQEGKIFYPKFGKYLQDMYADQKRLRPDQYDSKEHATITLMEEAFARGASEVSHVSHNRDTSGHEAIRDQITMKWDEKSGKGEMIIRNIAMDGNFHTTQSAHDVMEKIQDGFIEGHPKEGIFIFTDVPLESKRVHEILAIYEHEDTAIHEIDQGFNQNIYTETARVTEVDFFVSNTPTVQYTEGEVVQVSDSSLTHEGYKEEAVVIPAFIQRLVDTSSGQVDRDEIVFSTDTVLRKIFTIEGENNPLVLLTEIPIEEEKENIEKIDISIQWRQVAEKLLSISPEQSQQLLDEVQETWLSIQDMREVVTVADDTGVGIGAAFYAIDMMAHPYADEMKISQVRTEKSMNEINETLEAMENGRDVISLAVETGVGIGAGIFALDMLVSQNVTEERSLRSAEAVLDIDVETITLTPNEQEAVFSFFVSEERVTSSEESIDVIERPQELIGRIPDSIDTVALKQTREFVVSIESLAPEKQQKAVVDEKNKALVSIVFLWGIIQEAGYPKENKDHIESATLHSPAEQVIIEKNITSERESKHVEQFSFALTAWLMLKLVNYFNALDALENLLKRDVGQEKSENDSPIGPLEQIRKSKPEGLIQKETTNWLLLAIIWHLAMIREQGFSQQSAKKSTVKKKKSKHPNIISDYPQGVIFAFGS